MLPPAPIRIDRNVAHDRMPLTTVAMPIRLRKFIGAIALFVLVIVWALVAMALAQAPAIRDNAIASDRLLRGRRPRLGGAGDAAGARG